MKWFKHDSDANLDDKLQNLMLDHGLKGYGLYWYCLELIANKFDHSNITFELKHDARIIAKNTGETVKEVEDMMKLMIELGLFDQTEGIITCLKLGSRFESSSTSNRLTRDVIKQLKEKSCRSHDGDMTDKIRRDKIRLEENKYLTSFETFYSKLAQAVLGIILIGLGSAIYLIANLGPGPRDGLMTGLQKTTNFPMSIVRNSIELTVVFCGWLLGGTLGVGTVLFALLIGPFISIFMYWLKQLFSKEKNY